MEVLKIGICDDEKIIIEILEEKIREILDRREITVEIKVFYTGKKLLEKVSELDVVFLDIEMPDLDGIQTGELINQRNAECKIIMATSRLDRVKDAFKIQAFRFVTKPFQDHELEDAIESVQRARIGTEIIEVFYNRTPFNVEQKEIKYVETYDSYAEFAIKEQMFRKDMSLDGLETVLDNRIFFRIHKKAIVNMVWIEEYQNGIIKIDNKELPVSRRKKKDFERAYVLFDTKYR